MKAQRAKVMIQVEADHLLSKYKPPASTINLTTSSVSSPAAPPTSVMMSTTLQPVIVPQQQVLILPSPTSMAASTPTSRQIQPKPVTAATLAVKPVVTVTPTSAVSNNLRNSKLPSPVQPKPSNGLGANTELQDQKTLSAIKNLQKAAANVTTTVTAAVNSHKEESKKNTPNCQGCGKKKSEFVCAGCSNRWYCSRECQVCRRRRWRWRRIFK